MLGRLEMSIDDCIDAYSNMMDKVFKKKAKRLKLNGELQARFDTAELERCIKFVVKTYGMGRDENLLMQDHKLKCKVYVGCWLEAQASANSAILGSCVRHSDGSHTRSSD